MSLGGVVAVDEEPFLLDYVLNEALQSEGKRGIKDELGRVPK